MTGSPIRIALIASARHPIVEPFAGGLEAQTWALADGLRRRGHAVTLFAGPGSDPRLHASQLDVARLAVSAAASADVSMPPAEFLGEHHAYLTLMLHLMDDRGRRYDIVHNNSLHYLPVAMARALTTPMLTTLHTPPTPWLESAIATGENPAAFVAVSSCTADAWRHAVPDVRVLVNGVDLDAWRPGPGGRPVVWFGRMVAEKGPDLAARAARAAGLPLQLAGPISDAAFFAERVRPLLGDGIDYVGHLSHLELNDLVGRASATLVTPRWDEPYGLVAAESLACGTPVVGFRRGGLSEVVDDRCAILVEPDDVDALAAALRRRHGLARSHARQRAESHCSIERMIDRYELLYRQLIDDADDAAA